MSDYFELYGQQVNKEHVRRVWAAVTAEPSISVRELGDQLSIAYSTAAKALTILRRVGVIRQGRYASRAHKVVVPFIVDPRIRVVELVEEVKHAA